MTVLGLLISCFLLGLDLALSNTTKGISSVTAKGSSSSNSSHDLEEIPDEGWEFENTSIVDTRRILYSKRVSPGKRPYMVYLQLTKKSAKAHKYRGWLCGGVIVHRYYVLTSAACVEDADKFYIVSGTTKLVDNLDYKSDECMCQHRRKVVWKCIPLNYKFDFQDSIKWSSNDIAIVKVDKPFKLGVLEKGCEFATDSISYNNVSRELEKAGTKGYIAGWGSGGNFREGVYRRQKVYTSESAKYLQEAKVCIMDNEQCAKKWALRFRDIITQYMICTKDVVKSLSEICNKKYANCTEVESRRVDQEDDEHAQFRIDVGRHLQDPDDYTARRFSKQGGFCENDHGGPLIVKYQGEERAIGVISACKIDPKTHSCHGPFLYTSVFKNRQFISCAINKDVEESCRRVFRSGITHEEWSVTWNKEDEDDDDNDKALRKDDKADDRNKEKKDSIEQDSDSKEKVSKSDKLQNDHKSKSSEKKIKRHVRNKNKKVNSGTHVLRGHGEVFYESSREDNVNEPDEE